MLLSYLDPGSGSALVGTLIAVAGAALFSLKSFFYRLVDANFRSRPHQDQSSSSPLTPSSSPLTPSSLLLSPSSHLPIAIFSEGKNYWGTFRAIVQELIARKIHFAYYTLDLHDPALLIDSDYMHARLFDAKKPASFQKLARIQAKVLLATTPNIGTPGYPLKRPAGVEKLVHVFHAFADISAYHVGSLDNYDVVLTVGPHQEKPIREVEKARGLKPKEIIPIGLPYFDEQFVRLRSQVDLLSRPTPRPKQPSTVDLLSRPTFSSPTILVGPSWGAKGLLAEYGTDFIIDLAKAGYNIIVRPHPQSYIAEPAFIARCQAETAPYANVVWDAETVGTKSMLASSLLISDTSSIRFDYAFLYQKPVITLDIPHEKQLEYEGQYMSSIWTDAVAPQLGAVLNHTTLSTIPAVVKSLLLSRPTPQPKQPSTVDLLSRPTFSIPSLSALRSATITNLGTSAKAIVDYLIKEQGERSKE